MKPRDITPLEQNLAHNNGIELLSDTKLIASLEAGDRHAIADKWFQEFTNVHRQLFASRDFNHDDERPGNIWSGRGRTVASILKTLVKQLYDEEGFPTKPTREKLASYLADAFTQISQNDPFEYGNDLALRVFFSLIGKTEAVTDDKGSSLDVDFTRLSADDFKQLKRMRKTDHERIDAIFERLLDSGYDPPATPISFTDRWTRLPKSEAEFVEKRFLCHTHANSLCLVTVNGGLVPLDAIEGDLRQHLNRGRHPTDFSVSRQKIFHYLIKDGRETEYSIDGIPISDEAVPLFPLDVDIVTGLVITTQLPSVLAYCKKHNTHPLVLPEYIKAHSLPVNLKSRLERAAKRIEQTREVVWGAIDGAFDGKTPVVGYETSDDSDDASRAKRIAEPQVIMTMGGTASGKSNLETRTKEITNDN